MNTTKTIAALFDFDGVIMDTETQYTVFWDEQGRKYLNEEDFGRRIKGQTLTQIYEKYFSALPEARQKITADLKASPAMAIAPTPCPMKILSIML